MGAHEAWSELTRSWQNQKSTGDLITKLDELLLEITCVRSSFDGLEKSGENTMVPFDLVTVLKVLSNKVQAMKQTMEQHNRVDITADEGEEPNDDTEGEKPKEMEIEDPMDEDKLFTGRQRTPTPITPKAAAKPANKPKVAAKPANKPKAAAKPANKARAKPKAKTTKSKVMKRPSSSTRKKASESDEVETKMED